MMNTTRLAAGGVSLLALLAMGACATGQTSTAAASTDTASLEIASPAPPLVPAMDDDMAAVIAKLESLGGQPIETLTPEMARKQPTPADAVKAIMAEKQIATPTDVSTKDVTYTSASGPQKARLYKPVNVKGPMPIILYIHGGGWVIADIDTYDATPRALAAGANAMVLSIEYRHAPEARFPAAHDDSNAAYQWLVANAKKIGGDPKKIAVAGESAGGNMAMNVAITARDKKWPQPTAVAAIYPVADTSPLTKSKDMFKSAKPLNTPMLDWFFKQTMSSQGDQADPRLNLVSADLSNLPPVTIILAEIDPLHDDGALLAERLQAANTSVEVKDYQGVTHEFFGMGAVVADAKDAEMFVAKRLKESFGTQSASR